MEEIIHDVSDTALWVAHFRALETERPDAIFRDPYARPLSGERGARIAEMMGETSRYTAWNLSVRTHVIDRFILELLAEGVDLVLNLGAGLDSRPYRMGLPAKLLWIEADYPHMIEHKKKVLDREQPSCRLERESIDLADAEMRRAFLRSVAQRGKKILVITEGVLPYLTEAQAGELAADIHAQASMEFWIGEYFSPFTYRYLNNPKRLKRMKNSPFRFFPADWWAFFRARGWVKGRIRYLGEEGVALGRPMPAPWWAFLFKMFASPAMRESFLRMMGYVVYVKA